MERFGQIKWWRCRKKSKRIEERRKKKIEVRSYTDTEREREKIKQQTGYKICNQAIIDIISKSQCNSELEKYLQSSNQIRFLMTESCFIDTFKWNYSIPISLSFLYQLALTISAFNQLSHVLPNLGFSFWSIKRFFAV